MKNRDNYFLIRSVYYRLNNSFKDIYILKVRIWDLSFFISEVL